MPLPGKFAHAEKYARGPLAKLEDGSKGQLPSLIFPSDLDSIDHWVAFRVSKTTRFRRAEFGKKDTLLTIFLPMPYNLQTGYKANYSNENLGIGGLIGAKVASGASNKGVIQSIKDEINNLSKDEIASGGLALAAFTAESELLPGAAAAVSRKLPIGAGLATAGSQNIFKGSLGGAGIARNPHQALLFSGTDFRSHSFSYKFIPKNKHETDVIRDIITRFKYHMSPSFLASNHFFKYPENFEIDFHYPKYLFNIGSSILTSFNVNYHGEGQPIYFGNDGDEKAPMSIVIDLTFQEVTITTKEEIEKQNR